MTSEEYTAQFNEWDGKYQSARAYMDECRRRSAKVFFEVAAQHPLTDGLYPGPEFLGRLRTGAACLQSPSLYLGRSDISPRDVFLYVPGGRHMKDGVEDKVSLSESGTRWLKDHVFELGTQVLGGDDLNNRLTDGRGVFNGEDECKAAVRLFEELEAGRFICVCSQGQMMRKALAYIQLGYYPEFMVLPGTHHSPVWEAFYGIPRLLGTGTAMSEETRQERIAGGEPVFVYHEYSEDQPYSSQILRVFRKEEEGLDYLRKRAELVLHRSWDGIVATALMSDTVNPDYVSVNEGGVCKFFILDKKLPGE